MHFNKGGRETLSTAVFITENCAKLRSVRTQQIKKMISFNKKLYKKVTCCN